MEVDSMVAPELQPIESKVTFYTKILSSIGNGSSKVEGVTPILAIALAQVAAHSSKTIDLTFSNTTTKEE